MSEEQPRERPKRWGETLHKDFVVASVRLDLARDQERWHQKSGPPDEVEWKRKGIRKTKKKIWPIGLLWAMACDGRPIDRSVFYLSQTTLLLIYRPQGDGKLSWTGREIRTLNLDSGCTRKHPELRFRVVFSYSGTMRRFFGLCNFQFQLDIFHTNRTLIKTSSTPSKLKWTSSK